MSLQWRSRRDCFLEWHKENQYGVTLFWKVVDVVELAENCVSKAQGQFRSQELGEHLPMEAITRGLVKIQLNEKTKHKL